MIKAQSQPKLPAGAEQPTREKAIAGVILCGGSGTRMGRTRTHKVCVPVAGRAAIVRLIDTLRADSVDPLVVVVGHRAGEVIETIGAAHPGIHFVYQRDQLGTGHAARIGIEALCKFGYDGPVLITMGDKWFEPELIHKAQRRFRECNADLLLVSTPNRPGNGSGRLVHLPRRGIVGIVELRDINRARVLRDWLAAAANKTTLSRSGLYRLGLKHISPARKLWQALGPLAKFARGSGTVQASDLAQMVRETGVQITVGGAKLGPEEVERRSPTVNESVYIGKTAVLQEALRRIGRDNAQDEYYLTDAIEITAGSGDASAGLSGKVVEYKLASADALMAFNTRAELERIEEHVLHKERDSTRRQADRRLAGYSRTAQQWLDLLNPSSIRSRRWMERIYGMNGPLVAERIRDLRKVVRLFGRTYGHDRQMFLVRAPGRINLMGRHIDHQGGFVHSTALDREIVMAVAPRNDDVIRLVNTNPIAFGPRELVISDWLGSLATDDWLNFVDGQAVHAHLMSTAGDWSNYVLAAALYQQHQRRNRRIRGMDIAVHGNVPIAAGLSSSSSLVVAATEAITAVNAIHATGADIVSACGEAEWFVGSRGGSADHAAIRLSRPGHVARMSFHPFRLLRYVPIPPEAAVLIAYSGQHAVKSAGARDRFNERVACYRMGVLLLKKKYPRLASKIEYIRDLLPGRIGLTPAEVRRMIEALPEKITRRQLRHQLGPAYTDRLERIFSSHVNPGFYTLRDVAAFGVGECERSRLSAGRLEKNDLKAFGDLMLLSHDGDRVSGVPTSSGPRLNQGAKTDATPLHRLTGAYACSTEYLDRLVDITCQIPGVYGAQLAGAGLGGCVMILAKRSAVGRIKMTLAEEYYQPLRMALEVMQVRPVSGGGIIRP